MPRLIVSYPDSMTAEQALDRVLSVVKAGKTSVTRRQGKEVYHYCWTTLFKDGSRVHTKEKCSNKSADSLEVANA